MSSAVSTFLRKQDRWTEEEYLALETNQLIEYDNGAIEVLTMPTTSHQLILLFIYRLLDAFVTAPQLGTVLVAPLRIRLWSEKFREPDIVFMLREHSARMAEEFWDGADLVMEIVSEGEKDRERDLVTKRGEYAQARIAEYWIVDPQEGRITVLRLEGDHYAVHGEFTRGSQASSCLLAGFAVDVTEVFAKK